MRDAQLLRARIVNGTHDIMLPQTNGINMTSAAPSLDDTGADSDDSIDEEALPRKGTDESEDREEADSTPIDPQDVGMTKGCKRLYSGKQDRHGHFQWSSKKPKDLGKPAEGKESAKWAIITRYNRVYGDPKKLLTLHSLVIQSPLLKEVLEDVLAGYPGVAVELKLLKFDGLFEPLIHRWPALREAIAALEAQTDYELSDRIAHAKLLDEVMMKEFSDIEETMNDMKLNNVITYEHLWTIFEPGTLVYASIDNQDRALRLQKSKYGVDHNQNPVFWLTCSYVDFDGQKFGTQQLNINIPSFEGAQGIQTIRAYPFEFHESHGELKTKLVVRGGKAEDLAGTHYCNYNGIGWAPSIVQPGTRDKFTVKGRIIIDTFGYNRFKPNAGIYVTPLNVKAPKVMKTTYARNSTRASTAAAAAYRFIQDLQIDDGGMPAEGFFHDDAEETNKRLPLTEEQKMICTPFVRGYALQQKEWLTFFVNAVSSIEFNDDAFKSLKLPDNQKELVLGFTSTKQAYRNQFDDVIAGKGRGTIILLSGPPGVGKTLTAESVAEKMQVPLFAMAAGDLGMRPKDVETELQNILDMCARWNAILLLDEADVFLEARSLHEIERNKLVSIFLRVLEYYEGIMFLTTNRVTSFDRAFESRIHISLEYKDLDFKARRAIWDTFLNKHNASQAATRALPTRPLSGAAKLYGSKTPAASEATEKEDVEAMHERLTQPHKMSDADIKKLANIPINGRNIKNFLKTAQLLASHREEALSFEHIETVVEATQHLHKQTQVSNEARSGIFS